MNGLKLCLILTIIKCVTGVLSQEVVMAFRTIHQGFTLAELLIALAILGLIATFTIPKILNSQQNRQYNAVAKEDIAAMISAYQRLKLDGTLSTSTTYGAFTPYLNYIAADTSGAWSLDSVPTLGTIACNASNYACLKMHNGSMVAYRVDASFGGSNTTNAIHFVIDPDGRVTDGTTNGPGKSISIFIYYNGRIADEGNIATGTTSSAAAYPANSAKVPSWFSW
jgi:prepilin-type N-terminal cleavage/methylation domain-containing protein